MQAGKGQFCRYLLKTNRNKQIYILLTLSVTSFSTDGDTAPYSGEAEQLFLPPGSQRAGGFLQRVMVSFLSLSTSPSPFVPLSPGALLSVWWAGPAGPAGSSRELPAQQRARRP